MNQAEQKSAVLYCQIPIAKNTLKEFRVFKPKDEDEDYCQNCHEHRLQHTRFQIVEDK